MNIALSRLIEGIITTLRTDVIPNVTDAYARGQAVGVIDVLNNIAPRIEWASGPVIQAIAEKQALLAELGTFIPHLVVNPDVVIDKAMSTDQLSAECARLDAAICDVLLRLADAGAGLDDATRHKALTAIKANLHDELTRQMKSTRKPLFAEIATGGQGTPTVSKSERTEV